MLRLYKHCSSLSEQSNVRTTVQQKQNVNLLLAPSKAEMARAEPYVPAELLPAKVPAGFPAGFPAELPAKLPAKLPAELPVELRAINVGCGDCYLLTAKKGGLFVSLLVVYHLVFTVLCPFLQK